MSVRKLNGNQIHISMGAQHWGETLNDTIKELAGRTGWHEGQDEEAKLSLPMAQMFIQFLKYANDESSLGELLTSDKEEDREVAKLILEYKENVKEPD